MVYYAKQVDESVKEGAKVFMMLISLKAKGNTIISDLPIVSHVNFNGGSNLLK